ncbi:hypothetical protein HPB51_012749 [Rhipicephalus microplus]|uniref:RB1-inducible coiled-coil protein 1 n=1 Tax=Rhipicephalus microplus TaxID=6941 RepID=A0A9J6EAG5_RHIMP|nr:hypothetical protein HPB51_012749 [Rhipicephalus microplus]
MLRERLTVCEGACQSEHDTTVPSQYGASADQLKVKQVKMLYVFLVDTGKMVTFDMNHAVESVEHLKAVIHQRFSVPPEKQVLLISGGESLQPTASVGSYSAGTDTNPIYFFNKVSIESESLAKSSELATSGQHQPSFLEQYKLGEEAIRSSTSARVAPSS